MPMTKILSQAFGSEPIFSHLSLIFTLICTPSFTPVPVPLTLLSSVIFMLIITFIFMPSFVPSFTSSAHSPLHPFGPPHCRAGGIFMPIIKFIFTLIFTPIFTPICTYSPPHTVMQVVSSCPSSSFCLRPSAQSRITSAQGLGPSWYAEEMTDCHNSPIDFGQA